MDPVTHPPGGNPLWEALIAVVGFLSVTVIGWLKYEISCLRRDHDRLDDRVDQAERDIGSRAAYCKATSETVSKFMSRIEAKIDRLVESRRGGEN